MNIEVLSLQNGTLSISSFGEPAPGKLQSRTATLLKLFNPVDKKESPFTNEKINKITNLMVKSLIRTTPTILRYPKLNSKLFLPERNCVILLRNHLIGSGQYKTIYDAFLFRFGESGDVSASIKAEMKITPHTKERLNDAIKEDNFPDQIHSNHVIKKSLYQYRYRKENSKKFWLDKSRLIFISERIDFDLNAIRLDEISYSNEILLKIAIGAMKGLRDIHAAGFIHRDIKTDNIFVIAEKGTIGDLGFLIRVDRAKDKIAGTRLFLPPEVLLGKERVQRKSAQSQAQDIWAFGLMLYSIFHPRHLEAPFLRDHQNRHQKLLDAIDKLPSYISDQELFPDWIATTSIERGIQHIIQKMLRKEPKKRPTAEKSLELLQALL